MGYELARFIGEVDEEFHCGICLMVLENPLQSPCEHTFCTNCIKERLASNKYCPVDQKSLSFDQLKATPRYFGNLLDKLEITCQFKPKCMEILKLEKYQDHFSNCEHNPNAIIVCDKGCGLNVTRKEYHINNCSSHLANRFNSDGAEILQLKKAQSNQQEHFERELEDLREQFNNEMSSLRIQLATLGDKCNILAASPRWQVIDNIHVYFGEPHTLESGGNNKSGFAQSFYCLDQVKYSFKIQIVSGLNDFGIGLSRKLHTGLSDGIRYQTGVLFVDGKPEKNGPQWKIGDLVKCCVDFPNNFINDGSVSVTVNFYVNDVIAARKQLKLPMDGFFPIVHMFRDGVRIKYFNN